MILNVETVRKLQDHFGLSMMDAKKFLTLRQEQSILKELQENGTLEDKVNYLINKSNNNIEKLLKDRYSHITYFVDENNIPLFNQGVDETIKPE